VFGAFLEGWRRVLRAPVLAAAVLFATFLIALPLAIVVRHSLESHLGASLEADRALQGWNAGWAAEYAGQAQGLGRTFTHEILGFGGTVAMMSDLVDREPLTPAMGVVAALAIAGWTFLSGGILDRLARGRRVGAGHFFGICGVFFFRFLRLAVVAGAAYWAIFRWLHPLLFDNLFGRLIRDTANEHSAVWIRIGLYAVFGSALVFVSVAVDFAKVRAVVEDRRSMIGALGGSLRFIRRHLFAVSALTLLNVLAWLAILRLWYMAAPSAATASWLAFLMAELYLLVRVWAKLAFYASEVVYFQGELAHARYAASPDPVWPDSPAVEALDNLRT
jgi:hypothetical protein